MYFMINPVLNILPHGDGCGYTRAKHRKRKTCFDENFPSLVWDTIMA